MAKTQKKTPHPWLMAALICQMTLEDKDGVVSAIRIVDRFTLPKPPDWDGKTNIQLMIHGLIGFKAGDVKGERKIRLFGVSPKGKRKRIFETTIQFMGGDTGANMRFNMAFGFKTPGTHWIDVYVDRWLATRIPLTILLVDVPDAQLLSGQEKSPEAVSSSLT